MTNDQYIQQFEKMKESGRDFRERRIPEWNETYTLYRDKVITNRLTQRQTVNIPMMKYGITTLMKDIDEPPLLYFENLDNDEQKEIFYNETWKENARQNKLVIKDIVDKRQALQFGRSFKKLNIVDGKFRFEIVDPKDVLIDRYVDPSDIDTARFLIHINIYKTISELEKMGVDGTALKQIKMHFEGAEGKLESEDNFEAVQEQHERMSQLGVPDLPDPVLGENYVELNEIYSYQKSESKKQEVLHVGVVACLKGGANILLSKKELCDVIGETSDNFWYNHLPWNTWGGDIENTDFWSDGAGDVLRGSCRIVNSWYSQMVENRTLRNYGMNYYDSSSKEFIPQTFSPEPWGWYPVPGDPNKVIKRVDVPDLKESLPEIEFVMSLAEKSVAAGSTQQGEVEKSNVTLGEVQLALSNAKERVRSLAVFYNDAWLDFGTKYIKMLEGAGELVEGMEITRKGRLGKKNYTRFIKPDDYSSKSGYKVDVKFLNDKQTEDVETIQKLGVARAEMPDNSSLLEIYKKKLLEFSGLSMSEIQQVMEEEKTKLIQQITDNTMFDNSSPVEIMDQNPVPNALPASSQQLN